MPSSPVPFPHPYLKQPTLHLATGDMEKHKSFQLFRTQQTEKGRSHIRIIDGSCLWLQVVVDAQTLVSIHAELKGVKLCG